MQKFTLKQLRVLKENGAAVDLTNMTYEDIKSIKNDENGLNQIGWSEGIYGCSAKLFTGYNTGRLYYSTDVYLV